jgi:hypothetical protein
MYDKLTEPQFLVVMIVIVLAAAIDLIAYFCKSSLEHDLVVMILTTWNTGGLMSAINYAIGSSAGSKAKDEKIVQLAETGRTA